MEKLATFAEGISLPYLFGVEGRLLLKHGFHLRPDSRNCTGSHRPNIGKLLLYPLIQCGLAQLRAPTVFGAGRAWALKSDLAITAACLFSRIDDRGWKFQKHGLASCGGVTVGFTPLTAGGVRPVWLVVFHVTVLVFKCHRGHGSGA